MVDHEDDVGGVCVRISISQDEPSRQKANYLQDDGPWNKKMYLATRSTGSSTASRRDFAVSASRSRECSASLHAMNADWIRS